MGFLLLIGILFIALGIYVMINAKKKKQSDNKKGALALIGFGAIWCAICGLCMWVQSSEDAGNTVGVIFGYALSCIFICVGFNNTFIKPAKLKKDMVNCTVVQGSLIRYGTHRSREGNMLYSPVYGYYYNGEERILAGTVSSNSDKYRQIGRPVNIIINNRTGEIYCEDDAKFGRKSGSLFGIVGVIILVITILITCTDVFS